MSDERSQEDRAALVESRLNIDRAASIEIMPFGGMNAKDFAQVFEFAKGMSLSGPMVPPFCRGQPWACVGIIMQSLEWRMSPFSVARQAYMTESRRTGEQTIGYQSQLLHAVLEARAPLKERLRVRYEGEGDDMVCIVSGCFKGEAEPREWKSPRLGDRKPKPVKRVNRQTGEEYETTAGSPLWESKPLVQLFYDTSRDWARIYCPDVVMGIYGRDELEEAGFVDVTPSGAAPQDDGGLAKRLSETALARAGFQPEHAAAAIDAAQQGRNVPSGPPATPAIGNGPVGGDASAPQQSSPTDVLAPEPLAAPLTAEAAAGPDHPSEPSEPVQRPPRVRRRPLTEIVDENPGLM